MFDSQLNQHSSIEQCIAWKERPEAEAARQQLFTSIDPENSDTITHFFTRRIKEESNALFVIVVITMSIIKPYKK